MLREETAKLLMMIQGAYPNYKPLDKSVTVNTWHLALTDVSFNLAQQAFMAYLRSDTRGFAPTPGQLIARVHELSMPKQMNELEAWTIVEKAIRNSAYNSENEFRELPLLVQKAVGSSEQLRAWATDEAYNSQVVASHFMRVYRNEIRQQEEYEKLSDDLKKIVDQTNKNVYSAQIQQKNQEMVKSTWNKENVKIEAQEEETGISQQSNTKLQKLRSELQLKHK